MFFPSIDVFPEMFDPSYFSLYFSFFGFSPTLIDPVSHYTYPSEENPVPVHYIVDSDSVSKLLSKINVNKAIGPDDIPSWILRDHALTLEHPISTIFNASIREDYLPAIWRSAIVIPIPKVNPPGIITKDLRPISLTAVLSKQLEKIIGGWMLDNIVDRLDVN